MPILIGPLCASAVRRRTAGDATVAAPASPILSIARLDGPNCLDMNVPFPLASSFPPPSSGEDTGGGGPQRRSLRLHDLKLASASIEAFPLLDPRMTGEEA